MLSRTRSISLCETGGVKQIDRGKYSLADAVQGYIKFLRDYARRHTVHAADSRVREARAREIEVKTAQRLAHLVPLSVYEEMIDQLGLLRAVLGAAHERVGAVHEQGVHAVGHFSKMRHQCLI
jgi:hypothetical protein